MGLNFCKNIIFLQKQKMRNFVGYAFFDLVFPNGKSGANSSTILCSDEHVSYKGYSKDHNLKHIVLRSDLKQFVKKGVYHIQHAKQIKKVDWWYFLGSINKISAKLPQLVLLA